MVKVMKPTGKDAVSVRHIQQTTEDRKEQHREFKERKVWQEQIKNERFEKILSKRKQRKGAGRNGGINLEVTGDPK